MAATNALDQLKSFTKVVADTGDFESMKKYQPQDATTNPSLILGAAGLAQYAHLVDDAVAYGKSVKGSLEEQVSAAMDKVAVNFGVEILKIVPGRVSTELDARLSFDGPATIAKAHQIIELYKAAGIDKERVLVKIAATWEGIQAAGELEKAGIHCNLTLLFSLVQAAACAEAGITLISPFAGRITDFYKSRDKVESYKPSEDPGVVSVGTIYNYYKTYGYKTVVMGASFRTKEQVMELAGCDLLTIAPALLEGLASSDATVTQHLKADSAKSEHAKFVPDQKQFLWMLNNDEMAHFKLGEGIRKFAADIEKLEKIIKDKISA